MNPFRYKWGALPVWVLVLSVILAVITGIPAWNMRHQIDDWTWIPCLAACVPLACFAAWELNRESS